MIKLVNLSKKYVDKYALNNLNLEIKDGEIFGLIGHNGAGKSTTINLLTSMIDATDGDIYIDELDIKSSRDIIKQKIAYVPDSPDIFLNLTAIEYWDFIANVYGIDKQIKQERIERFTNLFDISDKLYESLDSFSHGMRQKVILIGALVVNPKIWILDEPMTGLDPQASFDLKQLMKEHRNLGNTVLFSTHVLAVAEQICDRIAILKKGQLIFVGSMEELKSLYEGEDLETIYLKLAGNHQVSEEQ